MMTYASNSNPSIKITQIRHDKSTSNLLWHTDICDLDTGTGAGSIKMFAYGSTYGPAKHHVKIALWVAWCHHPFLIVQDEELLDIFRDLNHKCITPSWVTVSRDVKEIFKMSQVKVASILQVYSCTIYAIILVDFGLQVVPRQTSSWH
jgi:hypothetical protein